MQQFINWYYPEPGLALNQTAVLRFRLHPKHLRDLPIRERRPVCHPELCQASGAWLSRPHELRSQRLC